MSRLDTHHSPTPLGILRPQMGYQPALDGLRAISVIAVLLYHGGFDWMRGGFFGVEVFFVVSGYLITALLLDEHERNARIDLKQFWVRRVRRLFPALYAVLAAVAIYAAWFGTLEQANQVRRDVPWAVLYAGNWGTILGDTPYFAGDPPLLRHLWSLAVEEQWYVIWPLAFVGIMALKMPRAVAATVLVALAAIVSAFTFWVHAGGPAPLGGPPGLFDDVDRTNFMYLSTITRSGGLLLGAAAAFVWRPWRWPKADTAPVGSLLDKLGAGAIAGLGCTFTVAVLTDGYVYQWLLPVVSLLSLVAIVSAMHPASHGLRMVLGWKPLVEVGKRSYGLYLWSWPISVVLDATTGGVGAFVLAMAVTIVVSEASYRLLETPMRKGALGRWWSSRPRPPVGWASVGAVAVGVVALVGYYTTIERFDPFAGGEDVAAFELVAGDSASGADGLDAGVGESGAGVGGAAGSGADDPNGTAADSATVDSTGAISGGAGVDEPGAVGSADGAGVTAATDAAADATTTTITPATSARLAIVGDSTANALTINLPPGLEGTFPTVANGAVDGCGVYDEGSVRSERSFSNNFAFCEGWQDRWASAAEGADVAVVVIGAWDVFDLEVDEQVIGFGTAGGDQRFLAGVTSGVDALLSTGVNVALLEVPCMRPIDVDGAGVPALPERGDDDRVARLNDLLRDVAADYGAEVAFVDGPTEWCGDEEIATNVGYRWDGVHVYKPGAKLIIETIAPDLLTLAAV